MLCTNLLKATFANGNEKLISFTVGIPVAIDMHIPSPSDPCKKLHHTMETGYVQKYSFDLLRQDVHTLLGLLMNRKKKMRVMNKLA